jgi:hypothetical protein
MSVPINAPLLMPEHQGQPERIKAILKWGSIFIKATIPFFHCRTQCSDQLAMPWLNSYLPFVVFHHLFAVG